MDRKCAFPSKTRTFLSDPKLLNGSVLQPESDDSMMGYWWNVCPLSLQGISLFLSFSLLSIFPSLSRFFSLSALALSLYLSLYFSLFFALSALTLSVSFSLLAPSHPCPQSPVLFMEKHSAKSCRNGDHDDVIMAVCGWRASVGKASHDWRNVATVEMVRLLQWWGLV